MENGDEELLNLYGNRIRVRACGILIENQKILLVKHRMAVADSFFWAPPGGGISFGESAGLALEREFLEETGLRVQAGKMLFVNEFVEPPLHAIELFFSVQSYTGRLLSGYDPEFSVSGQIIEDVAFLTLEEIKSMPEKSLHSVFAHINTLDEIFTLSGLF